VRGREVFERHEARRCINCGEGGHGAAVCTNGYRDIAGVACAEVLPQQAPAPAAAPPKVEVLVQAGPQPVVKVDAPARPLAERGDEELAQANWTGPDCPRVSRDVLQARLTDVVHARISSEKGESWVAVSAVAKALGAVKEPTRDPPQRKKRKQGDAADADPPARSAEEIQTARNKYVQGKARAWADKWWPKHAEAAVTTQRVTPADAAGEQLVARSGAQASLCVKLDTVFAVYGR